MNLITGEWNDLDEAALSVYPYEDGSAQLCVDPDPDEEPITQGVYIAADEADAVIEVLQSLER